MDSENDSIIPESVGKRCPPENTQPSEMSSITYAWVILFVMDVNLEKPLKIVRLSHFKDSDFPWEIIKSDLNSNARIASRKFKNMGDQSYGIFAKIEKGIYIGKLLIAIQMCKIS